MATTAIVAWQLVHNLSHEFNDNEVNYFGVTPDGREVNCKVDINTQAFCMLMDNFGSKEDLVTTQTNLGLQLLIHGSTCLLERKESEDKK